jgi:uncharacterized membrane protein (DUF373 family)
MASAHPLIDRPGPGGCRLTAERLAISKEDTRARTIVARAFTAVEDVVYIGLGMLLAISAMILLGNAAVAFFRDLVQTTLPGAVVGLLDRLLLVLMVVELLTVQVSFREHSLVPEPFLIVGLVAVTRRILVLTAELPKLTETVETTFRVAMIELGVLTLMIVALVASLLMLRRRHPNTVATRA